MFKLLSVVLFSVGFCYATNCYELQQSQISSLNDRMSQMLSSFYTPSPQTPLPAVAAAPASEYNNPYSVYPYPYPYPVPQNVMYGPPPAFYPPPPVPSNPATISPTYCKVDPREYNSASNWASYYDSYHQYYDYARSSPYNPLVPPYQMPPSPYATPLAPSLPPPSQYITPCSSSPLAPYSSSPPPPFYPSWDYVPYNPEYATYNYAPPSPIPPYALPLPPPALPAPYPQLYHRHTEGSPPYYY